MLNLANKTVLVLGLGETGLSMARFLARRGASVRVADTRISPPMARTLAEKLPDATFIGGAFDAKLFDGVSLVAISPGVDRRDPAIKSALARGMDFAGDVELFARELNTLPAPVKTIGITGSNGKTTVTTMVGEMCKAAGLDTVVAGNIGLPILDAFEARQATAQPDVYVLELSSFQLESTSSLKLDAATVLNLSEDHLDRYDTMADYAQAKARIFQHATCAIINRDDARSVALVPAGIEQSSFGLNAPKRGQDWGTGNDHHQTWLTRGDVRLMPLADLPLAGSHNAANALAALALTHQIGLPLEPVLNALCHFEGLPHRVQPVAEINGVTYYDDSKGTNVGATVAALQGLDRRVVLIAGGEGKGQDFSPLKDAVMTKARAVVLIGRDAAIIESAICASQVTIEHARSMQEAVSQAALLAEPGDAVLLSPACASFDMFRDYEHRAEVFIAAVRGLGNGVKA